MTAGMCVPLVVFLSAVVLHPVSAGGVYCAKTARARAAALGLDYPGVHGAPGLYGPAHHGMHPSRMPFRPQAYNNYPQLDVTESSMASYRQSQPEVRSLYDKMHQQAHPRSWHRTSSPVRSEYTTNQVLALPRGWSVFNRKSNFEEVKHVAPPTLAEAPGQLPKGRNKPLSVPALGSSGITNEGHAKAMRSQSPAVGRPKSINLPQPLHMRLNVKPSFQGNPVPRSVLESYIRSS